MAIGTKPIHTEQQKQGKSELFFKVTGSVLNADAQSVTVPGYSPGRTIVSEYSAKNRHQPFLLSSFINHISGRLHIPYITGAKEVIPDFIPLFRFLIFPKHWFW